MDVSSPPHYRRLSRQGQVPSAADLPPYTRRNTVAQAVPPREPTEHRISTFHDAQKATPWATLKVYSSAKSSKSLPTFYEKENINGSVDILSAEKGDSILAITANVTGRIITGANSRDTYTFLNIVVPLWAKISEGSRSSPPASGAYGPKLVGPTSFPFSVSLPREVDSLDGSGAKHSLPETFLERQSAASVQYELTIIISRGKLRSDYQIKTAFGYVPSSRPSVPSPLRQLAYQQGMPLPGPDVDPEGWHSSPTISISGKIFKSHKADAQCKLSLAKPLCYTRGSVLPCSITIESSDAQALDLLSTPSSILVTLQRRVKFHRKPTSNRPDAAWSDTVEDVGTALWWPYGPKSGMKRSLEGEIQLVKDLKPTSSVGHFSISYAVVLHPFNAAGYTSTQSGPLLVFPVDIASMYCRGPKPLAYSPPSYDTTTRPKNDYYASIRGLGIGISTLNF